MPTAEGSHTHPGAFKPDNDYLADEYGPEPSTPGLFFLKTVGELLAEPSASRLVVEPAVPVQLQVESGDVKRRPATTSRWGIIDAKSSATERGTVAIRSDCATMNGTLRKCGVNTTNAPADPPPLEEPLDHLLAPALGSNHDVLGGAKIGDREPIRSQGWSARIRQANRCVSTRSCRKFLCASAGK